MKKIFTIISTVLITTTAFAQTEFGIQAGLNIAHTIDKRDNPSKKYTSKSVPGINIGAFARIKVGAELFIQPGLQYNQVGAKGTVEADGATPAHEETQKFSYLSIPLTLHYKSPTTGFSIYAGPQLGILLSQTASAIINGQDVSGDINMLTGSDFSFLLGTDYTFKPGIIIGLRSQLGIANVFSSEFITLRNLSAFNPRRTINNVTISIGYIIGKTKKQS